MNRSVNHATGKIFRHGGELFSMTIERDDDIEPPWVITDGHGPVEVRSFYGLTHCPTAPGERVLHICRGTAWVYDAQKAQQIALRDGWGISDELRREMVFRGLPMTRRRIAALAVEQDMDYLRGYLRGAWYYVVVIVTALCANGLPSTRSASVGGLECGLLDYDDYISQCAHDLAQQLTRELYNLRDNESVT